MKILNILFIIVIIFPTRLYASGPYRCNGRIQYEPCIQATQNRNYLKYKSATQALKASQTNALRASYKFQQEGKNYNGPLYAKIVSANYQKYSNKGGYGQWRGIIKGNGDIHLSLLLNKNGAPPESRYMGHVKLKEDQTSFNFISTPPQNKVWSWKILAVPKY